MNDESIEAAAQAAREFLRRLKAFETTERQREQGQCSSPRESGALRRASMDLTRALAAMRRPG